VLTALTASEGVNEGHDVGSVNIQANHNNGIVEIVGIELQCARRKTVPPTANETADQLLGEMLTIIRDLNPLPQGLRVRIPPRLPLDRRLPHTCGAFPHAACLDLD